MQSTFNFKPLQETDLNLLCAWFKKPHVLEWWPDCLTDDEIKLKYKSRIGSAVIVPFIAYLNEKPIGFIQYYHANKAGDDWCKNEMEGTVGIDQLIGVEDYLNQGYGTQMISEFIKMLFEIPTIKKIITDVDPNNHRAIKCYEKVGFQFVREVITPDGASYLMELYKTLS